MVREIVVVLVGVGMILGAAERLLRRVGGRRSMAIRSGLEGGG
jgi:hypothetical protein